ALANDCAALEESKAEEREINRFNNEQRGLHTKGTMVLRPFVDEPKGEVANYPYFERGKDSTMAYLYRLFQERIVMFDGAMGTMIQKYKLGEEDYRGERFKA
ncbi:unnamed protein product, partial [Ectocarpus sp. 6 AP-2014]